MPSAGPVLALIPARSGSKGIPGKNSRVLAGKPLLGHAIESAVRVGMFDRIVLTTDSQELAAIGRSFGAETPFLRPPELAADDTPMLGVVQHAVRMLSEKGWTPEIIVLLQPTAPFRRDEDVVTGLSLLQQSSHADSVVSVERVPSHYSPHVLMKVVDNRLFFFMNDGVHVTNRQSAPFAYSRNGQFYMVRRRTLLDMNSIYGDYSLPYVTTHKAVNLDTLDDWEAAERLAEELGAVAIHFSTDTPQTSQQIG
jgi:CMP-N,N'-diacetyllegionaminic acid synthase